MFLMYYKINSEKQLIRFKVQDTKMIEKLLNPG